MSRCASETSLGLDEQYADVPICLTGTDSCPYSGCSSSHDHDFVLFNVVTTNHDDQLIQGVQEAHSLLNESADRIWLFNVTMTMGEDSTGPGLVAFQQKALSRCHHNRRSSHREYLYAHHIMNATTYLQRTLCSSSARVHLIG